MSPPRGWRCRLGLHRWAYVRNDDGQRYRTCSRCHRDDDYDALADPRSLPPPAGGGGS